MVLTPALCADTSITVLDLVDVDILSVSNGFYIPEGVDCRHITNITFPVGTTEMHCGFGSNTISHQLFLKLLDKCMVVETNSIEADTSITSDGEVLFGAIYPLSGDNTMLRSIHAHAGEYPGFTRITFSRFSNLEIVEIGDRNSSVSSFNSITRIQTAYCPKLSRYIIGGQSSFASVTYLYFTTHSINNISPTDSDGCPYVTNPSPFVSKFEVYGKDSFPALTMFLFAFAHCVKDIELEMIHSANSLQSLDISAVGGSIAESISIKGSDSYEVTQLMIKDIQSAKKITLQGTNLFGSSQQWSSTHPAGFTISNVKAVETIDILGANIFKNATAGYAMSFLDAPKLETILVDGSNILTNINLLAFQGFGVSGESSNTNMIVKGMGNLLGFDGSPCSVTMKNIYSTFRVQVVDDETTLSRFKSLTNQGNSVAECEYFETYLNSVVCV